ncbi:hypothetical protein MMC30_001111 [Trapelia coarctata]|nr:hypothetical protein [Trapelia coarctata]
MSDNSNNEENGNFTGAIEDGVANQEINKLAGEMGVSSALDGILDKEADQYIGGTESTGSNASNEGMANTVEDGMVNQEVNKVADEFGVPGVADGVIDQVVDEEVNKFL